MQDVIVFLEGGVIHDVQAPKGVRVIIRDYDVEDLMPLEVARDADGQEYVETVWEGEPEP